MRNASVPADLQATIAAVSLRVKAGDLDGAWQLAAPLRDEQARRAAAAHALAGFVREGAFRHEQCLEALRAVFKAHSEDDEILAMVGRGLERAFELDFLNAAPPDDPLFGQVAARLRERALAARGTALEAPLLSGLSTAARVLGRGWDAETERADRALLALRPTRWQDHYGFGLFLKVRGRYSEGLEANRRAVTLGAGDDESVQWNLGICATGARDGPAALAVWKALGSTIELGRFGLPDGKYHQVKVRLAEHPVAERSASEAGPGLEETIWIERLSPCHGIVRSALYQELGVDYGDVVLFDGAPITKHTYGDRLVPVFPHLSTLERRNYRVLPFAGTQSRAGAISELSGALPDDTVLYVHSEQFQVLCASCWQDQQLDHAAHATAEHHVVRGKLCAPPELSPTALRGALDAAIARSPGVSVLVPELSALVGDHARAEIERRRLAMTETDG